MAAGKTIDRTLLDALARGDTTALAEIYEEYAPMVYAVAFRFTGDAGVAMDILQDVFVALPESVSQLRIQSAFEGWLRRVAVRASLARLREGAERLDPSWERPSAFTQDPAYTLETLEMERAISALPARLRAVFVMRAVEGFGHDEIAETLGISRNASLQRMHRARMFLRSELGE